jgi:hypothetical protein
MKIALMLALLHLPLFAVLFPPPQNLRVIYGEQSLDLTWDSVPGAAGYNIYTAPSPKLPMSKKRKINPALITSGSHFTYIWDFEDGIRERKIKGRLHYLSVTAVFEKKGRVVESKPTPEADDFYFKGYENIDAPVKIKPILRTSQAAPFLPVETFVNKRKDFFRFMEDNGKKLLKEIKANIDPLQVGACAPISTLLVKLLQDDSLYAYRIEGNFINEYHTFVLLNIDSVEYILDFSADQFTPGVVPVFFPRDLSHLNDRGKLAPEGRDIYLIGKIYSPEQSDLTDTKAAQLFREIHGRISGTKKE